MDDLSGGRLTLGLGAGWQEREHESFGWNLLPMPEQFHRFEEGLDVITQLLHSDTPVHFEGAYYHLNQAILLPTTPATGWPTHPDWREWSPAHPTAGSPLRKRMECRLHYPRRIFPP